MKPALYLVVALAILGGLFAFFKPVDAPLPAPAAMASRAGSETPADGATRALDPGGEKAGAFPTPIVAAASAPDAPMVLKLEVRNKRLVSGPAVTKLHQGDHVVLEATLDVRDELHLHGYNLRLRLLPGQPQALRFVATKTGRFTYELHHADLELGALEVYPR